MSACAHSKRDVLEHGDDAYVAYWCRRCGAFREYYGEWQLPTERAAAAPASTIQCECDAGERGWGHRASCPVAIGRQKMCRHPVAHGRGTINSDGTYTGETWCSACGKKLNSWRTAERI